MSPRAPSQACVVPPAVMQHAVLLGRDIRMRFTNRSYGSLHSRPSDHRIFGEIELSHHSPASVKAYAIDPVAPGGGFRLRYEDTVGVTLSDEPQLLAVNMVCSNGSWARTRHYLVDMLPQFDLPLALSGGTLCRL